MRRYPADVYGWPMSQQPPCSADGGTREINVERVVTPFGLIAPAGIEITDGIISCVEQRAGTADAMDVTLVPGFVDLQVNGRDDVDIATASAEDILRLDGMLVRAGTTSWLPTVVTRPLDEYSARIEAVDGATCIQAANGTASILGLHLEGPFLGRREGAHRRDHIVGPDLDFVAGLTGTVRLMTIGPEVGGAVELAAALVERGIVVAIGHTEATTAQLEAVAGAGASLVTHLFNAMPGLHHRDETVVGWSLVKDDMSTSVIADLEHVSARALRVAVRCKPPERLVAVSDNVAHLSEGQLRPEFVSGGHGDAARLSNGTIAGSTASLADCFANLVAIGVSVEHAVAATSTNPSRLIGARDRGVIAVGARADLVALDRAWHVRAVWRDGRRLR